MQQRVYNLKSHEALRRRQRKRPTDAEKLFWLWVRNRQLGVKFRRQHGIGRYIVDFYCAERKLVVELDGASHDGAEAVAYDRVRDQFLEGLGLRVLRFSHLQILFEKEAVVTALQECLTPPCPSP